MSRVKNGDKFDLYAAKTVEKNTTQHTKYLEESFEKCLYC